MAHVKPREGSTLEKPPSANPGELDANLTMLLLLGAGDFSGKKGNKHRNVLGQVLVSSATWENSVLLWAMLTRSWAYNTCNSNKKSNLCKMGAILIS